MESAYRKGAVLVGAVTSQIEDEKWNRVFGSPPQKARALREIVQKACPQCGNDLIVEYVDSMNAATIACVANRCSVYQRIPRSAVVSPEDHFSNVMNEVFATVVKRMKEEGRCPLCRGDVEFVRAEFADTETCTCLQCGYSASYCNGTSVVAAAGEKVDHE